MRFLIWAALAGAAFGDPRVHHYPDGHFSISIPEGWAPIPPEELHRLAEGLRQAAPHAEPQVYNYGFAATSGPTSPRLLIQVKSERWDEDVFAEMDKLPRAKGLIQHGATAANPPLAELQPRIGELRWDQERRILWMRTSVESTATQALSAVHLTNAGSVQIHCSASSSDYDRFAPVFVAAIESVQIDEDWRYRARNRWIRLVQDHPWPLATAAGVCVLLAVNYALRKRLA
jgi:hypothetical protein